MRYWLGVILSIIFLVFGTHTVFAHANLVRSNPPANTSVDVSPAEIRLWFTESLESGFSRFTLRDNSGAVIATPPSAVVQDDPTQMMMQPGELPDGLYTVSWRVLSTDGHSTEGSFAFGIGVAVASTTVLPTINETIPVDSALIRWINLLSLSLAVGSLAFWLFVWTPAVPQGHGQTERRMQGVIWCGWVLLGASSILMLLLQVSIAGGISVFDAVTNPALGVVLSGSYYGQIWQARLVFWLGLGGVLWLARRERWLYSVAFILGGLILLTNSFYSHASTMQQDTLVAVIADWLHLTATAVWIGGLIQFFVVIGSVRHQFGSTTSILSDLVGHFSNFMRVTVAGLIVSGFYAAWLQVGSLDALFTTVYGQVLLVKLLLVVPLLAISAVNLILTRRGLQQRLAVWTGRLRGLVGAEITLTVAILAAVGVMTAIAPARTVLAVRNAGTLETADHSFLEMQTTDTLMVHLGITPGYVGENTFMVTLFDPTGHPITDATRIRLRFDYIGQNLGQSELRPELQSDGSYTITGANLSIPGTWRIRMTVQRPNEFDTLMDFEPTILAASPPSLPVIDTTIPPMSQWLAILVTGLVFLGVGGFFTGQYGLRSPTGPSFAALILLAVGMLFFLMSVVGAVHLAPVRSGELTVRDAWTLPLGQGMAGGIYLTIDNGTNQDERLVSAITDAAETVEIHQTRIENDIARMEPFTGLDIPAGGSLTIMPGQYHLMLVNLQRDLSVGETIMTRLHFASGRELTVQVSVQYDAESQP
jgi:copper transport protein